ncbi:MAG: hypothetical protein AAF320_00385 [Myxococcota bacterium]
MKRVVVTLKQQGQQQVVKLPQSVHLQGNQAMVEQVGNNVVLTPVKVDQWPDDFWQCLGKASEDLCRQMTPEQNRDPMF